MKTISITLFNGLLFLSLFIGGCDDRFNDCKRGNDTLIEETREIEAFNAISISNGFVVEFKQSDVTTLHLEAEENLMDQIFTKVIGNTLILKKSANSCISERRTIRIYVTSPTLEAVNLSGSGRMEIDTLNTHYLNLRLSGSGDMVINADADEVEADISGSGEIRLRGEGDETNLEINGSGNINAFSFAQRSCVARISGSGDMELDVSEFLKAEISGSGDITYLGNPIVVEEISGSGSVKQI